MLTAKSSKTLPTAVSGMFPALRATVGQQLSRDRFGLPAPFSALRV